MLDFVEFVESFGTEESRHDLNGDGRIDFFDLIIFAQFFEASANRVTSPRRVFMKGNQWLRNNTGHQLSGFDMIRLSSFMPPDKMRAVTDTLNLQLMIGLSPPYAAPGSVWAGDVIAAYPEGGAMAAFESWVDSLKTVHNIPVSAFFYNLEVPHHLHADKGNPIVVSAAFADLVREYKRILMQSYPDADLWVFSTHHTPAYGERISSSCDWELLTTGPHAADVCNIGSPLDISADDIPGYKSQLKERIQATKQVCNGRDVVWQVMAYGTEPPEWESVRNSYHLSWETFKELIRYVSWVSTEENGREASITYYQSHYVGSIELDGASVTVDYSQDGYGEPPSTDIPWADLGPYPARLWEEGFMWRWDRSDKIRNRWEAEFVGNFLVATGYSLPGGIISEDVTWSGKVTLLGDVEIEKGATLTISPGTEVCFRPKADLYALGKDPERTEIIVTSGVLTADAEGGSQIVFRSARKDLPESDDWYGVRNAGGTMIFRNCLIRDAASGLESREGDIIEDCTVLSNGNDSG